MATLTIRNLEPEVKQALRERAARRGVSMEEEARDVLRSAARIGSVEPINDARELMAFIRSAPKGRPIDPRYALLSQKEITDLVSDGLL